MVFPHPTTRCTLCDPPSTKREASPEDGHPFERADRADALAPRLESECTRSVFRRRLGRGPRDLTGAIRMACFLA
jgi:hypothetical protein